MKHPLRLYTIDGPARAIVDLNTRKHFGHVNWVLTAREKREDCMDDLLTEDEAKAVAASIRNRNENSDLDAHVQIRGWGTVKGDEL